MEHLEPRLWLLFFGTAAAVGLALLLAEQPWPSFYQHPQPTLSKAANLQWGTAAVLVRAAPQLSPRSSGGRVMMVAFGLLVLIVTNLYTSAATVRVVTEHNARVDVSDMGDLAQRPTGIFVDDADAFERFGLQVGVGDAVRFRAFLCCEFVFGL